MKTKEKILQVLKHISSIYFNKKDYISAEQINLAMDVIEDCSEEEFPSQNCYDGDFAKWLNKKAKEANDRCRNAIYERHEYRAAGEYEAYEQCLSEYKSKFLTAAKNS